MVLALWISLVGVSLVASLTPGAGAINTMSNALTVGWKRAFWGIVGQQLGILAHVLVAAVGIGVLITGSPVAFAVVRYVGAGYLIFIGLKQFFARPTKSDSVSATETPDPAEAPSTELVGAHVATTTTGSLQVLEQAPPAQHAPAMPGGTGIPSPVPESGPSSGKLVRRGFWVNVLNPKAVVFFLAIMPQFISADLPAIPQYVIIALTMIAIDATIMWFVFAAAAEQFRRFTGSARGEVVTNRIFGTMFVLIAVFMLLIN